MCQSMTSENLDELGRLMAVSWHNEKMGVLLENLFNVKGCGDAVASLILAALCPAFTSCSPVPVHIPSTELISAVLQKNQPDLIVHGPYKNIFGTLEEPLVPVGLLQFCSSALVRFRASGLSPWLASRLESQEVAPLLFLIRFLGHADSKMLSNLLTVISRTLSHVTQEVDDFIAAKQKVLEEARLKSEEGLAESGDSVSAVQSSSSSSSGRAGESNAPGGGSSASIGGPVGAGSSSTSASTSGSVSASAPATADSLSPELEKEREEMLDDRVFSFLDRSAAPQLLGTLVKITTSQEPEQVVSEASNVLLFFAQCKPLKDTILMELRDICVELGAELASELSALTAKLCETEADVGCEDIAAEVDGSAVLEPPSLSDLSSVAERLRALMSGRVQASAGPAAVPGIFSPEEDSPLSGGFMEERLGLMREEEVGDGAWRWGSEEPPSPTGGLVRRSRFPLPSHSEPVYASASRGGSRLRGGFRGRQRARGGSSRRTTRRRSSVVSSKSALQFLRVVKIVLRVCGLSGASANSAFNLENLSSRPGDIMISSVAPPPTPGLSGTPGARPGNPFIVGDSGVSPSSPASSSSASKQQLLWTFLERFDLSFLWDALHSCLTAVESSGEEKAFPLLVATIVPVLEAFLLFHSSFISSSKDGMHIMPSTPLTLHQHDPLSGQLLHFLEEHKKVLNFIIKKMPALLSSNFQPLLNFPRILDFENKKAFFRSNLRSLQTQSYGGIRISCRREHVFEDSFMHVRRHSPEELRGALHVTFEGEPGIDAGGLTREWFVVLAREMFNPDYALFIRSADNTFQPNPMSKINIEHLDYFMFVGRVLGLALITGNFLDAHFTRSLYKHIVGLPITYHDLESIDPEYYRSIQYIYDNDPAPLMLTFEVDHEEFGVRQSVELKENGSQIHVTNENKREYIQLVSELKMTTSIKSQLKNLLQGLYDVVPKKLLHIFTENEIELLISGLPEIDVDDWRANTEYQGYHADSPQIQWLWQCIREFSSEERALLLQFVTGTSKVPLDGFASLPGMRGNVQIFSVHRSHANTNSLPTSHTCFNQLDLPEYESLEMLRDRLSLALRLGNEGFGFG